MPQHQDTNARFQDVFSTTDFEFVIRCKKCGSTDIDANFNPGFELSDETGESASLQIWCKQCGNIGSTC